jgi:hypothetical protein
VSFIIIIIIIIIIHIYFDYYNYIPKQTMFLGYMNYQLFCGYII